MIIVTSGTFNFLLSAEGACMSANDDSNLPEVEKIPLVIDAEFTEEEELFPRQPTLSERLGFGSSSYYSRDELKKIVEKSLMN